jgi:penicillin amidase
VKEFYHTHRGPVIEHLLLDLHIKYGFPIPNKYRINHTLTFSSTIYQPDPDTLKGLISLAFCNTFEEFQHASSLIKAPNIDSVFITDNGTYGYGAVGRVPKRKVPEMGGFVKDGSTDEYDMGPILKWEEMAKMRNPKKGYVSMANNKFAVDSFDSRTSIHEASTGRSYRIQKMIT